MSVLENQVIQNVYGKSDDILLTVLHYLKNSVFQSSHVAVDRTRMTQSGVQRIGIAEHENLYDDSYDLDEQNDEIAKLFGVDV